MKFPRRIYTDLEVKEAKELVDEGYKHRLRIAGSPDFDQKAKQALRLVKIAGYYDFLRTYIRRIEEIDGLTQLRQSEATIWANDYAVENPVDAAGIFVQKANQMKEYLESKLYYGGIAEKRSNEKRIEFLEALRRKSREKTVIEECEKLLDLWRESSLAY